MNPDICGKKQAEVEERLSLLAEGIRQCSRCGLCRTRNRAVPGEGKPEARVLFVGEGPGADEDACGRPFVGRSGKLLRRAIATVGVSPAEVFIANIVKCRPPDNRVPSPEEAEACRPWLDAQIEAIRPAVLVCVGATSMKHILGLAGGITKHRGQWYNGPLGIPCMPIFHPSYLLRNYSMKQDGPLYRTCLDIAEAVRRGGIVAEKTSFQETAEGRGFQ